MNTGQDEKSIGVIVKLIIAPDNELHSLVAIISAIGL
jgi:hypothetical protein